MLISDLKVRPRIITGCPVGVNQFREFPARRYMNKAKFYTDYIRLIHAKPVYRERCNSIHWSRLIPFSLN
jgi:hypothetical protein